MIFELVLNGVGGCTIEQAKQNLTMRELRMWGAYRDLRGSLNIGRRLQQELAQLHYSFLMSKGAENVSIYDLMPNEDNPATHLNQNDAELLNALLKWSS